MKINKINRIKKTQPLTDKSFWCSGCDAYLVLEGQKCPNCGRKSNPTKHFKNGRTDLEDIQKYMYE